MLLPETWLKQPNLRDIAGIAPFDEVDLPLCANKQVRLFIKREDRLHPQVGGNKLYKLHGYLRNAQSMAPELPLASFGGAHSNHILALAKIGAMHNLRTVGVIRGEAPLTLSPTLCDAEALGMHLHFVSRADYRLRRSAKFIANLEQSLGTCFWIPEGGAGLPALGGCADLGEGLLLHAPVKPDVILHACGTGTSLAGLALGLGRVSDAVKLLGVAVLKGYRQMDAEVAATIEAAGGATCDWQILHDYHLGGYAKYPKALAAFVQEFEGMTGIPLDPVYTSKVMWTVIELIKNDTFSPDTCIVVVHSGGLQGRRGFGLEFNTEP